jgi:hypothetical protein
VATSRGDVTLVLPDPGTQALLERDDLLADPVRAAQAVYAELAVIWRESPVPPPQPDGTPTQRGLALQLPTSMPPGLWPQLTGRLAAASFLAPAHVQDHVAAVVPAGPTAELLTPSFDGFSDAYAGDARRLRREVDDIASMYTEPTPLPARLRRNLYTAEALTFLDDELGGRAWLASVGNETSLAFERVTPQVQVFTLTSREGDIPLLMGDPGPVPMEVTVQLQSRSFQFPDGSQQELELEPGRRQVVTFSVISTSAGRHQVLVLVRAPSGRVVSEQRVEIRSTALNTIALVVTGAAALVLFALWLRRWVRRRTP